MEFSNSAVKWKNCFEEKGKLFTRQFFFSKNASDRDRERERRNKAEEKKMRRFLFYEKNASSSFYSFYFAIVSFKSVQFHSLDCIYRNVFVFIQALTIQTAVRG